MLDGLDPHSVYISARRDEQRPRVVHRLLPGHRHLLRVRARHGRPRHARRPDAHRGRPERRRRASWRATASCRSTTRRPSGSTPRTCSASSRARGHERAPRRRAAGLPRVAAVHDHARRDPAEHGHRALHDRRRDGLHPPPALRADERAGGPHGHRRATPQGHDAPRVRPPRQRRRPARPGVRDRGRVPAGRRHDRLHRQPPPEQPPPVPRHGGRPLRDGARDGARERELGRAPARSSRARSRTTTAPSSSAGARSARASSSSSSRCPTARSSR